MEQRMASGAGASLAIEENRTEIQRVFEGDIVGALEGGNHGGETSDPETNRHLKEGREAFKMELGEVQCFPTHRNRPISFLLESRLFESEGFAVFTDGADG